MLPLKLYLTLEKKRKAKRELDANEAREKEAADRGVSPEELKRDVPQNFDAECEHIHNKVLFDCINDSLLQFKPFGKEGEPLPWSRQSRRLKPTDDFNLNEIFEIVKHDLVSDQSIQDRAANQLLCVIVPMGHKLGRDVTAARVHLPRGIRRRAILGDPGKEIGAAARS